MAAVIEGSNCAEVWEKSVRFLIQNGIYVASVRGPVLEYSNVSLLVNRPWEEPRISTNCPLFNRADGFSTSLSNHPRIIDWDGINQLEYVIKLLRNDPVSRRAVISVWDPKQDPMVENAQGVISILFQIRAKQLHLTSILRTTDAWMCNWSLAGIPELQRIVYDQLHQYIEFSELNLGTYTQFHSSFHIYLDEVKNAELRLISNSSRRS